MKAHKMKINNTYGVMAIVAASLLFAGCNQPTVRVWSGPNGTGSNRNFNIDAYFSDLRNDRYDNVVDAEFMDDNISGVANFSDSWVVFAEYPDGVGGHGPKYCFPPHQYFPDLSKVDTLMLSTYQYGDYGTYGWSVENGVNIDNVFSSHLPSFQGGADQAMMDHGCAVVLTNGKPLPSN
jgi:hypothetical protein